MEQNRQKFNSKQKLLEWSERIASCRNSERSVKDWCQTNGIPLYEYTPHRKPENAEKFLAGFHGYLHAAEYQGYHNQPADACMAYARRKLIEALESIPE